MFFALSLIMSTMRVEEQSEEQQVSTEDEIMVPIHQMKVLLPLENWHDLLAFVPRSQLGSLVSEIGDYEFTRIIQSFLHDEVRKITLGKMEIIPLRPKVPNDQPMVHVMPNTTTNMPDWPMPGNIKNFKQITLNGVDTSALDFLGKFQQNSLLADVNMHFVSNLRTYDEDILSRVLTKIVPFITSIDSIESRSQGIDLFEMAYNTNLGPINESQLLVKEMMAETRILVTNWRIYGSGTLWEDKLDWFCSWLYTPRNDGKPRMLRLCYYLFDTACASFIERIKQDFQIANHPVSFFIHTSSYPDDIFEEISIDNLKTNEKLVIKNGYAGVGGVLLIWRYPLKAAKNWIEANENEITTHWNRETLDRKITLTDGLTIGI